jgi:hypothetical protein
MMERHAAQAPALRERDHNFRHFSHFMQFRHFTLNDMREIELEQCEGIYG